MLSAFERYLPFLILYLLHILNEFAATAIRRNSKYNCASLIVFIEN